jgi:hypothetical protein
MELQRDWSHALRHHSYGNMSYTASAHSQPLRKKEQTRARRSRSSRAPLTARCSRIRQRERLADDIDAIQSAIRRYIPSMRSRRRHGDKLWCFGRNGAKLRTAPVRHDPPARRDLSSGAGSSPEEGSLIGALGGPETVPYEVCSIYSCPRREGGETCLRRHSGVDRNEPRR